MRRGRRLTSIIAIPLVIHLVIASAAFPAAMTGGGSMHAATMHGRLHHGSSPAAMNDGRRTPASADTAPCCGIPCAPDRCGLPGHCAVIIDRIIATATGAREPSSAGIPTVLASAPRSVTTGPEPPPPRPPTS